MNKLIVLPFLPISLNRLYKNWGGRITISKEGRDFVDMCTAHLLQYELKDFGKTYQGNGIILHLTFYTPKFYTKAGHISNVAIDVGNSEKKLVDLIFKQMKINDGQITSMLIERRYDKTARTEVMISFIE